MSRRERSRRQASDWLAKLNGPHDERDRAAFAEWYRASPDHAASYDRLSALLEVAGEMRPARMTEREPTSNRRSAGYALAAAATVAGGVLLAFAVLGARSVSPGPDDRSQTAVFVATADASTMIHLADGSDVELSPGARLSVHINGAERRLRLERGEGRFVVFHDGRPFIVAAERTTITARGTEFRVRLGEDGTFVSLLEGRIDVSYPVSPGRADERVARLAPGEHLLVPAATAEDAGARVVAATTMVDFDDATLGEAVERMNRTSAVQVRLADPELAKLQVTGAFRAGDAAAFAEVLAAAVNLELAREADGGLVLHRPLRSGAAR